MDPDNQVLIEGVLFRARYLGSTQLITDGNPTKLTRMLQAQEAVGRIKVRHLLFVLCFLFFCCDYTIACNVKTFKLTKLENSNFPRQ